MARRAGEAYQPIKHMKQCGKHLQGALLMSQRAYEDFQKQIGISKFREKDLEFHSELTFAIASLRKANSLMDESLKALAQIEN